MAFLTIAGIAVEVQTSGAAENAPERVGESVRTFDGTLRSTVRDEKRSWSFQTGPMTEADYQTLKAAVANAAQVTCAGDALGGSVTCEVRITKADYLQDVSQAADFSRILQLALDEV